MTPQTCPNCGADVPKRAKACPECGACEETGWSEQGQEADLGLPDDSFDYDNFVQREFGGRRLLPHGMTWFWCLVSVAMVALLVWFALR
jgi:hypothetical protein